jgi:hypothetical protein
MTECKIGYKPQYIGFLERSKWTCYLFGNRPGRMGMSYTPQKGQVPNRFVRFMMRICFDCYWVKEDD